MLKKSLCLILSLFLLAAVIPAGAEEAATVTEEKLAAEFKFADTFFAPASVDVNGNNGWVVSGTEITVQQVTDPTSASNHVLKLVRTAFADNTAVVTKNFAEQTGKQKVSLRLNAKDAANSKLKISLCGVELSLGLNSGIATVTAGTEIMQGSYNGYEYNGYLGAYPTNAWFEFGVVADTTNGSMDVFINGNQVNIKTISGTAGSLSQVGFTIAEAAGTWYADDLKTANYQESAADNALTSKAWQTICSENMQGLKDSQTKQDLGDGRQVEGWRRNGAQHWTGAAAKSIPTTNYMAARFRGNTTAGYLSLERKNISGSGYTDWPYYNFKTDWQTLRLLGGKVKANFFIKSTSHSSSDDRPRYFGLADKDGNDVLKLWVKKTNLYWSASANKWMGSLSGGQTLSLVVDYSKKTFSVYANGNAIVPETSFSTTAGAPAKLFFGLEPKVASTGDTTQIDDIIISQWNEYAVADLWATGVSEDLEGSYANGSAFAKTADWTPAGSVVWSIDGSVSAVKVNAGGSMQRTLGLQKNLVIVSADVKAENGAQTIVLKDYNNGSAANTLATVSIENGKLKGEGTEVAEAGTDWFTLRIVLNTATGEYWLYKGDTQLNAAALQGKASADVQYVSFAAESGAISIRSFAVSAGNDTAAYTIRDVVMKQGEGEFVNRVGNGVTVQNIQIAKSRDGSAAKAIVAVYKDNVPVEVRTAELAGSYSVGSVITLPLNFTVSRGEGSYRLKAFLWNDSDKLQPLAAAYEDNRKTSVLVAGDSIAQTYNWRNHYPMTGYGQTLDSYLDTDKVAVNNFGLSGTSTVTFETSGQLGKLLNAGRSGDYVTIQFAHNDQGQSIAIDVYKANLKKYIAAAKEKGMNPILITSPIRRPNSGVADLGNYPDAMRAVATETGTPLIDLNNRSIALMNGTDDEGTKLIYMHINANDERYFGTASAYSQSQYNKSTATVDNTHFTVYGAHLLSKAIAEELAELTDCGLSAYAQPNKTNPESFKPAA